MTECLWKFEDENYEFIKGEVIHIFEVYKINCVPVSGFEIANKMGIKLIPYSQLSQIQLDAVIKVSDDGFLLETHGTEYIYFNDMYMTKERQNWTILYEIGHIVLDHFRHDDKEEAEADFFAKYAIAPPVLIFILHADSEEDIHQKFKISYEAAKYTYQYYKKWLKRHENSRCFTNYEERLIELYKSENNDCSKNINIIDNNKSSFNFLCLSNSTLSLSA